MWSIAIGNPWIFEQIKYYLETGLKKEKPSNQDKYKILKEHIEISIKEKGEKTAINEIRKYISAYSKDMPGASKFRDEINHINNYYDFINKIKEFYLMR